MKKFKVKAEKLIIAIQTQSPHSSENSYWECWECGPVVGRLPRTREVLSSMPSTGEKFIPRPMLIIPLQERRKEERNKGGREEKKETLTSHLTTDYSH